MREVSKPNESVAITQMARDIFITAVIKDLATAKIEVPSESLIQPSTCSILTDKTWESLLGSFVHLDPAILSRISISGLQRLTHVSTNLG
jgi:hypothetical protein